MEIDVTERMHFPDFPRTVATDVGAAKLMTATACATYECAGRATVVHVDVGVIRGRHRGELEVLAERAVAEAVERDAAEAARPPAPGAEARALEEVVAAKRRVNAELHALQRWADEIAASREECNDKIADARRRGLELDAKVIRIAGDTPDVFKA